MSGSTESPELRLTIPYRPPFELGVTVTKDAVGTLLSPHQSTKVRP